MLQKDKKECLLANIGFDTAENEHSNVYSSGLTLPGLLIPSRGAGVFDLRRGLAPAPRLPHRGEEAQRVPAGGAALRAARALVERFDIEPFSDFSDK